MRSFTILFFLFFFSSLGFSQKNSSSQTKEPTPQASSTENKAPSEPNTSSATPALDSFFSASPTTATTEVPPSLPAPEMPSAWGPFFFLLFVAVSLYYGIKYLKKKLYLKNVASSPVDFIKTIATVPVTPNASLAIIEINTKYFIFSVTTHQIQMIQEIEDQALILQIKTLDNEKGNSKSFREIITSFFQVKVEKKIKPNISEQEIQSFVKQQKERLDRLNEK